MVKRVNSMVDIANGTRKFAIAKVLEKRDKTAQQASSQSNSALGVWHGMAPKGKTGQMVSGVSVKHGKYYSTVYPTRDYRREGTAFMKVVNAQNKRGIHTGFFNRYRAQLGKSFLTSVK